MDPRRLDYTGEGIGEDELLATPYAQVRAWVDAAVARSSSAPDVVEPLAAAVATVDAEGRPNVRTVLLRFLDERGPGFVTALTSTKGREIADNPRVAAGLTWPAMYRAVRFRGVAVELDRDEVAEYWRSRPWGSRISAWASQQSQPVSSRAQLEAAARARAEQFPDHGGADDVPVPDFWGGYRVVCDEVELWGGRRDRLHDRIVYRRVGEGDLGDALSWEVSRRQP
ncbi:pyridoxamine 5'-phosphate oxidase [Phycicoccus endophyticus]|uniref:Pyridoxamine 5'-phosphate oxidase n=1 Tax=Phycicoccus endophyticus TaxID=1690220 RepID=A0A7G9R274_9MICO|nr:pyridoxamine 5'-phosphate oxidase [Phycicoccus endophyticus]NHI19647.1 pyridoxamine 5'-phosphate oxidase [Phycicoccus endophyticus]QNN49699.1 pyridoxamine 5'-phosphate oxidase [Phycicoccus endophyticus]GGL34235.1 pyridoxine/pyridoxamine 5'-phosphate oxidase [Phycicoccus endophyticus]